MRKLLEARVDRGISALNARAEKMTRLQGWPAKISLEELDMGDPDKCVLGQLFQGFWRGLSVMNIYETITMETLGFAVRPDIGYKDQYKVLTEIWKEKLQAMRTVDG